MVRIALAQQAPVFLRRHATLGKVILTMRAAAGDGANLIVFPEAHIPGYPVWLENGGARFNHPRNKEWFRRYYESSMTKADICAIRTEAEHLGICAVVGGIGRDSDINRSLYCTVVIADGTRANGALRVHRKMKPTYEERLVWADGDSSDLRAVATDFGLGGDPWRLSALNCWENWMPAPRTALYGQGVDLHCMVWPGSVRNTDVITRFVAQEGRMVAVSVSGVLRPGDVFAGAHQAFPATHLWPGHGAGGGQSLGRGRSQGEGEGEVKQNEEDVQDVSDPERRRELAQRLDQDHRSFVAGCNEVGLDAAMRAESDLLPAGSRAGVRDRLQQQIETQAREAEWEEASESKVDWSGESTRDFWIRKYAEMGKTPLHDGGSCVAGPDGQWVLDPVMTSEGQDQTFMVDVDRHDIVRERHNFDPNGHYSRPDVFRLQVRGQGGDGGVGGSLEAGRGGLVRSIGGLSNADGRLPSDVDEGGMAGSDASHGGGNHDGTAGAGGRQ